MKKFHSPTVGKLDFQGMLSRIEEFMEGAPEERYRLIIGTDSGGRSRGMVDFVTALIVHRVGGGGIYFWKKEGKKGTFSLHRRIYEEALLSLEFAQEFLEVFHKKGFSEYDFEIHVDIGRVGDTREMISEVVGMIQGSGFKAKIKPESFGASTVADRHA